MGGLYVMHWQAERIMPHNEASTGRLVAAFAGVKRAVNNFYFVKVLMAMVVAYTCFQVIWGAYCYGYARCKKSVYSSLYLNGKYIFVSMETMIKYLKLPFEFSAGQMQQEVRTLSAEWIAHYNMRDYEGSWTALPLRSVGGLVNNVIADAGDAIAFKDTVLMEQCPYLKGVAETFKCEKKAIRLLNLQAGAVIKEHKDKELSFESGEARIHVPVMTNDAVEFYLDSERVVLDEGDCWYMNFNLNHRVTNAGRTDRIHLVMDCMVNDWMRELFTTGDWLIKSVVKAPERYTATEKIDIIKALKSMNTPQSLKMAAKMEAGS